MISSEIEIFSAHSLKTLRLLSFTFLTEPLVERLHCVAYQCRALGCPKFLLAGMCITHSLHWTIGEISIVLCNHIMYMHALIICSYIMYVHVCG